MHPSHPKWVTIEVGQSVQLRPIIAHRFHSNAHRPVLIFGSIHGDEEEAHELCRLLEARWTSNPNHLKGRHVLFVPSVNPDGVRMRTRQNSRQVDCNRNFQEEWAPSEWGSTNYGGPSPLSEPETQALYRLVEEEQPRMILSIHACTSCSGMNNFDGPAQPWAEHMTRFNAYPASSDWHEKTPGSFGTYAGKAKEIPVITLEMPSLNMKKSSYSDNIAAVEAAILMGD